MHTYGDVRSCACARVYYKYTYTVDPQIYTLEERVIN